MIKRIAILSLLFVNLILVAQKANYTISKSADKSEITIHTILDLDKLQKEDSIAASGNEPQRTSFLYPLGVDMNNSGLWTSDNGVKKWKLILKTPGSFGIILDYKYFYIPNGATLRLYNEEESITYTSDQNPAGGAYASETYMGDQVTIEYSAPESLTNTPRIEIDEFGYKYRYIDRSYNHYPPSMTKAYTPSAGSCMMNVNCAQGDNWQDQKRGVVRLVTNINNISYNCSGSVVNNTRNDGTPYILTASHCITKDGRGANPAKTQVYFEDEFDGCVNGSDRPPKILVVGADTLVNSRIYGGSDGALMKLTSPIPSSVDIFFNGWALNNTDNTIANGVVIHHPQGDVKKISVYTKALTTTSWNNVGEVSITNAHWNVQYSQSVTEGGSSGSPLFDQNGLIVGTLTGGNTSCSNTSGSDQYGKFYYHWDKNPDPDQRMKKYLDPDNKGVAFLKGMNRLGIIPQTPSDTPRVYSYFLNGSDLGVQIGDPIKNSNLTIKNIKVYSLRGYPMFSLDKVDSSSYFVPNSASWHPDVYIVMVELSNGESKSLKVLKSK